MTDARAQAEADVDTLLRRAIDLIASAKSMPLSASVLISRDEVLELLEDAVERFPDELREARWMLREREEFIDQTRREGDRIVEAARAQAERMVQRTEIARQAQHTAQRTLEAAREESRRLRHDAEDYCDQKLAAFEIVLERTARMVQSGREKLRVTPQPLPEHEEVPHLVASPNGEEPQMSEAAADAFFDQDRA